jgi:hypothetical protein
MGEVEANTRHLELKIQPTDFERYMNVQRSRVRGQRSRRQRALCKPVLARDRIQPG